MRLIDRLLTLTDMWASANGRSTATLASRVARDGKLIDRLREGRNCTVETSERFFAFFRDPTNWPNGELPGSAAALLNDVALGHGAADAAESADVSSGKTDPASQQAAA